MAKKKKKKKRRMQHRVPRAMLDFFAPGPTERELPDDFRTISTSQAIMEYAKPLFELTDRDLDMNEIMQVSTVLWNYSLSANKGMEDEKIKKKIIKALMATFGQDKSKAEALLAKMVERHDYLFPEDIQPQPGGMFMLMRKEKRYTIEPFDTNQLGLSGAVIPPDEKDTRTIDRIKELDALVSSSAEYEEYEQLYLSLRSECEELFLEWLNDKGCKGDAGELASCIHIFITFIYAYNRCTLKSVPESYLVEFFDDFLLRKMMAEPDQYVYWPPALKLFYQCLKEKGYLDDYKAMAKKIERQVPSFLKLLQKQFS